jgi:WD40 repeat protein
MFKELKSHWKRTIGIFIVATALVFIAIQHFGLFAYMSLYRPFKLSVDALAISSDGNILATVGRDGEDILNRGQLRFWDIETGSQVNLLENIQVVEDIAFSSDGTQVALSGDPIVLCPGTGSIQILALPTGDVLHVIYGRTDNQPPLDIAAYNCTKLYSPAFSPAGDLIAFVNRNTTPDLQCCGGNSVQVADIDRNILHSRITGQYSTVAFSPSGDTLVLGRESQVILWSVDGRNVLSRFEGHTSPVTSVAFSPDGTLLASSDNQTIRLWNLETGQQTTVLQNGGIDITFSRDGAQLIYASGSSVTFWDIP